MVASSYLKPPPRKSIQGFLKVLMMAWLHGFEPQTARAVQNVGKTMGKPWENHGKTSSSNSVENRSPISFSKIKLHVHKPGGHTQPRFRGLTHHQCQRQLVLGGFNPLETCRIQRANANTSSKPIETAIHLHWRSKTILTWSLEKTISGKF